MKLESTDESAIKKESKTTETVTDLIRCYVALGSNMGDSKAYMRQAVHDLENHPDIHQLTLSKFYKSKPHGPQDQPDYLNAAVSFETNIEPEALLDLLQKIENDNDRVREGVVRWGARTLDLDLLFYADQNINTKRLTVPHPRMSERAFVLFPLRDLIETLKTGNSKISNLKISETSTILECIDTLSSEELNNIKELDND